MSGLRGVLAVEVRRTRALLLVTVVAGLGGAYLLRRAPFLGVEVWPATWSAGVTWLDRTSVMLGSLAAAVAAWVGGRERRHRVGELLAATPRPVWHRTTLACGVLAAAVTLGFAAQAALALAGPATSAAYGGGAWPLAVGVVVLGVVTCVVLGFLAGRLVAGRLVAPAVALVLLLGSLELRPWPVGTLQVADGWRLRPDALLGLCVVLVATCVAALVLSGAAGRRRRVVALVPAAVAALAMAGVLVPGRYDVPDPAARAPVCTTAGTPRVCVQRVHAAALPEVAAVVRERTASVAALATWQTAREESVEDAGDARTSHVPEVLDLPDLTSQQIAFHDGLRAPEELRGTVFGSVVRDRCSLPEGVPAWLDTGSSVAAALLGVPAQGPPAGPGTTAVLARLEGTGGAQDWMGRWVAAAQVCDEAVLRDLARP